MNFLFDNNRPIYLQLVEQIRINIISGGIKSGERLPSVRDLATVTKVNPNTMQKALVELEEQGLVYTERTNGKYVTTDIELIKKFKDELAQEKVNMYLQDMKDLGFTHLEATDYLKKIEGEK